jgi:hypothetical protein
MIIDEAVYLEHWGVRGMKWGYRQSKSKTGIGRGRSALIDRNNRSKLYLNRSKNSKGSIVKGARFVRAWTETPKATLHISEMNKQLDAQNKRLKKGGHPKPRDFIQMYAGIPLRSTGILHVPGTLKVSELVVSNHPK